MTIAQQALARRDRCWPRARSGSAASISELSGRAASLTTSSRGFAATDNNNSQPMNQDLSIVTLVLHASFVVQIVMVGPAARLARQLDGDLRQALRPAQGARRQRRVRARVLGRPQPQRPVRRRHQAGAALGDGAHLRLGHARVPQAAREARRRRRRAARRRAPRDARELPARARRDRVEPLVPRLGRLGLALRRPVRHRLGNHACVHRPVEPAAGDAGDRRAGHRRGAGRHRDRPVRGDPGGDRLQPLRARDRPHRDPARDLHRGVLEHPAAQRRRHAGGADADMPAVDPARRHRAGARSTRSTWSRSSTSCWCC